MKARVTFSLRPDGELEIHLNLAGRDLLVEQLQGLNERSDHFHFGPVGPDGEEDRNADLGVAAVPYRAEDKIIEWGKVLFRPDEWDIQYYPHVMAPTVTPQED